VYGYDGLLTFFGEVMEMWAAKVQTHLDVVNERVGGGGKSRYPPSGRTRGVPKRRVVVRAYLPGHDKCHTYRSAANRLPEIADTWNWAKIPTYNEIFEVSFSSLYCLFFILVD
jgi:hypothetical protein